jgi:hypothetical protein
MSNKRKEPYTALEIIEQQNELLMNALETMLKTDWSKEKPEKIAVEFPIYITKILLSYVKLTTALLLFIPKDETNTKSKKAN